MLCWPVGDATDVSVPSGDGVDALLGPEDDCLAGVVNVPDFLGTDPSAGTEFKVEAPSGFPEEMVLLVTCRLSLSESWS